MDFERAFYDLENAAPRKLLREKGGLFDGYKYTFEIPLMIPLREEAER